MIKITENGIRIPTQIPEAIKIGYDIGGDVIFVGSGRYFIAHGISDLRISDWIKLQISRLLKKSDRMVFRLPMQ